MRIKESESIVELPIELIERGFFQPREYFGEEAMASTKASIAEKGQKVPVIVREIRLGNPLFRPEWSQTHYELADGERRFRCCRDLGLSSVKALVRDLADEEMLDYALTTNDSLPLNPIERARAFRRMAKDFGKTQEQIAKSFNLKQQQVSEIIRLLELPEDLQDLTARAVISIRHARELLKISDSEKILEIGKEVADKKVSTREIAKIVKELKGIEKKFTDKLEENRKNIDESVVSSLERSEIIGNSAENLQKTANKSGGIGWFLYLSAIILPGSLLYIIYRLSPLSAMALAAAIASIFIFDKIKVIRK